MDHLQDQSPQRVKFKTFQPRLQWFRRTYDLIQVADYQSFRNFVIRGDLNDITAVLDNKTAIVPLSLTKLH
jgi:hypothetical protein